MAKFSKFQVETLKRNLERFKKEAPIQISEHGRNFFLSSFRQQGWTDRSFEPWQEVKRRISGTPEYEYPITKDLGRRTRAILIGNASNGNRLQKSIGNCIREATFRRIVWGTDVRYAGFHNEGDIENGGHLPKRKFMGNSFIMRKQIEDRQRINMKKALSMTE